MTHGSLASMDKALDADPCSNHKFMEQSEALVQRKIACPSTRVGKSDSIFQQEYCSVQEQKTQGLKMPKRKFMALDIYELKHGAADPSRIKTHKVNGAEVRGVDVVDEEDIGIYEYVDQSTTSVSRTTMLSDPDLILSRDQNAVIFAAAARQMPSARDDSYVVLPRRQQQSSSSSCFDANHAAGAAGVCDEGGQDSAWDSGCFFFSFAALHVSVSVRIECESESQVD